MQMDSEENENSSISEDVFIAGTSTESQQQVQKVSLPARKRAKIQVRPNMSCGVNVSVNKIGYVSHIYRI